MDSEYKIKYFFSSFLELIMQELENNRYNSDLTNRKIRCFSDFVYNNGKMLLENNENLSNYVCVFYLQCHNHNFFGKPEYYFLTESEKENAKKIGSRQKYNRIPMEYYIHDVYNSIESRDIPLLVRFFSKNINLFEEINKNIDLIV